MLGILTRRVARLSDGCQFAVTQFRRPVRLPRCPDYDPTPHRATPATLASRDGDIITKSPRKTQGGIFGVPPRNLVGTLPAKTPPGGKMRIQCGKFSRKILWGHSQQNTTQEQNEISLRKILKSQNTQLKAENPKSLTLSNSSVPRFHNPPSVYSVYSVVQFPRVARPHSVIEKFVV